MLEYLKNKGRALILVCFMFLSGLTGYGGAYVAIHTSPVQSSSTAAAAATTASSESTATTASVSSTATSAESSGALTAAEISGQTVDSVVEISTETVTTGNRISQYVSEGAGSGVIISSNGYIVTNNHVIDGASKITVRLRSGKEYSAALVGIDSQTDIAVLKIAATGLKPVTYGDSDKLTVGELAVAIGNPLGELGGTVTEGIISALNRTITIDGEEMSLLQTDAAINPGNSGGGLFNDQAQLVGIVNAKSSGTDVEGLGFAIPINSVKTVIQQIIDYGYVQGRIDLGITMVDVDDQATAAMYRVMQQGVYVSKVTNSSYFKAGDRIVSVDGKSVSTKSEVNDVIESHSVGDKVTFVVVRNNKSVDLTLTLAEAKN